MQAIILKSVISGKVAAPPSKSYTIRALMCAALADGESIIRNPLKSDDTGAALSVLSGIGVKIAQKGSEWLVTGGKLTPPKQELNCRESAATLRFMCAVASLIPGVTRLTFGPGLAKRPMLPLFEALSQLGIAVQQEGNVIVVNGGKLSGGEVTLNDDLSSQYISALMLIGPFTGNGLVINLPAPPRSKPYILMTRDCQKHFGIHVTTSPDLIRLQMAAQAYQPTAYQVEGDWSQASYLLALGALSGEVLVTNLNAESLQGDRIILNLLQKMGARFSQRGGSVMIYKSPLKAIDADLTDAIDLLPTIAVLASVAEGVSELRGISRARLKESDRIAGLKEELFKLGIRVIEEEDSIKIIGSYPRNAVLDSMADHRLAMAFAILGTLIGGITIKRAESVSKTFPEFWQILQKLGAKVKLDV
jgi:3-phosphoshikimate 1-carboxyvinyltransferase